MEIIVGSTAFCLLGLWRSGDRMRLYLAIFPRRLPTDVVLRRAADLGRGQSSAFGHC